MQFSTIVLWPGVSAGPGLTAFTSSIGFSDAKGGKFLHFLNFRLVHICKEYN